MHGTWSEFETVFDGQYVLDTMKDLKMEELLNLEERSMSMIEYEQRFLSLFYFCLPLAFSR